MNFTPVIKKYMKKKSLNQSELAKRAGISEPAVSDIMNERASVNLVRLERISQALGVPMWKLVKEAE